MSASLTQRLSDLTAAIQTMNADDAKFRADVVTALATIASGPLTADQQAAFDNIMSLVTANATATVAADAALPQPTAPTSPANP